MHLATLWLVLPVTFGYTPRCRSTALALSTVIYRSVSHDPHADAAPTYTKTLHYAHRQSLIFHRHHKPHEEDSTFTQCHLDALAPRLNKMAEEKTRMINACFRLSSDAPGIEAEVVSAKRIVGERARATYYAAIQHCLDCVSCHNLEGST